MVDVAVEAFAAVKRTKYRANVTFKPSKFFAFAIGNPSELCKELERLLDVLPKQQRPTASARGASAPALSVVRRITRECLAVAVVQGAAHYAADLTCSVGGVVHRPYAAGAGPGAGVDGSR